MILGKVCWNCSIQEFLHKFGTSNIDKNSIEDRTSERESFFIYLMLINELK